MNQTVKLMTDIVSNPHDIPLTLNLNRDILIAKFKKHLLKFSRKNGMITIFNQDKDIVSGTIEFYIAYNNGYLLQFTDGNSFKLTYGD